MVSPQRFEHTITHAARRRKVAASARRAEFFGLTLAAAAPKLRPDDPLPTAPSPEAASPLAALLALASALVQASPDASHDPIAKLLADRGLGDPDKVPAAVPPATRVRATRCATRPPTGAGP
jgi:hypothetical protein